MRQQDNVRLDVAASPEFLHLARVTGSGLASRLGFTYEDVDDLRLAIDELCFALIGSRGRQGTVELRYTLDSARGTLEVEGLGHFKVDHRLPTLSTLSRQILSSLVDDYEVYKLDPDVPCFRLVKRGRSSVAT